MPAENRVVFTTEEQERCREAFMRYDRDRNGTIDAWELKAALESFGSKATDEEVFLMIAEVDMNANGVVDFAEFVKVLTIQKEKQNAMSNEEDLSAFARRRRAAGGERRSESRRAHQESRPTPLTPPALPPPPAPPPPQSTPSSPAAGRPTWAALWSATAS